MMIASKIPTHIETLPSHAWDAVAEDLIADIHEDERTDATHVTEWDCLLYEALTRDRSEDPKGPWVH